MTVVHSKRSDMMPTDLFTRTIVLEGPLNHSMTTAPDDSWDSRSLSSRSDHGARIGYSDRALL